MNGFSLREAATAVATQIEQIYGVTVSFVWNNTDANRLGFRLPGPHTVGFVVRTYYSDGSEFLTVIPLAKAVIKDPANMGTAMDAFGRAWIAALENEVERLRPFNQPKEATPMPEKTVTMLECPSCHAPLKPPNANREQMPDSGGEQTPAPQKERPTVVLRDTGVYVCPKCDFQMPRTQALLTGVIHCPECGTHLAKPSRKQMPDSGRNQPPRRNEEKRPL
jgi:ribosomal protein L37AE/L43A